MKLETTADGADEVGGLTGTGAVKIERLIPIGRVRVASGVVIERFIAAGRGPVPGSRFAYLVFSSS